MDLVDSEGFDVAIIGGGVIGLACAWRLAQRGARVGLFERLQTGREASYAAGGMLAPSCESALHPWNCSSESKAAMLEMCFASRNLYSSFADELFETTGIDIELSLRTHPNKDWKDWRDTGILYVAHDDAAPQLKELEAFGTPTKFGDKKAVLLTDDGQVENRKLASALRVAAVKAGVRILESSMIRQILIEEGEAKGLIHGEKKVIANQTLLTAGAWSGKIQGVPAEITRPLRPVAGQVVQLRSERRVKRVIYSEKCYLVPRQDGRLIVGATWEDVGFQKRVTAGGVSQLVTAACELVPELRDAPLETHWAGLRPVTQDNLPLLGTTSIHNLYAATGHGRNGILLCPATAEAITGCLLDHTEIPAAFSPARFADAV